MIVNDTLQATISPTDNKFYNFVAGHWAENQFYANN